MRPKGKLFALLAVFAAIGLVTATGAFTTVQAERTATVNTAGDSSALVAIEPTNSENANDYAQVSGGTFELDLAGDADDDDSFTRGGLNMDALTTAKDVFKITNQGSQSVAIYIEKSGNNTGAIAFGVNTNNLSSGSDELAGDGSFVAIDDSSSKVLLEPGETIYISLFIDTSDADPTNGVNTGSAAGLSKNDNILNGITINAEAADSADYDKSSS